MKKIFTILCVGALVTASGTAMAESIKNRFGITGRAGFIVPSDSSEVVSGVVGTNVDVIGGGGFIYGITDHVATELDITHAGFGSGAGVDFEITNITLGAQYRFSIATNRNLVPYVGGGLDILINDANQGNSVDDVVGAHVSGGVDFFVQ
ncbi:MAG TPA: outer membrane beta-barrel protein, partial [Geobacteraceae bacterium]